MSEGDDQPKPQEPALTLRQRRFVDAYVGEAKGNASAAARMAGYSKAMQEGWRLLRNAEIQTAIKARVNEYAMSPEEVLSETAAIARAPWDQFTTLEYGPNKLSIEAKMRLTDKLRALELLGKYHRLFVDRQEHTGPDGERLTFVFPEMAKPE